MKGFIFRLERVLRLRSQVERQRAQELARAIREEQERKDALERAAARLDLCSRQLASAPGDVATAGTLHNLGITMAAAANQTEQAAASHDAARDQVESEQQQFGTARMERRVVERLRERRRDAWNVEQSRADQREQDGLHDHRRTQEGEGS